MKKRILVPYVAATLAMAASISVAARDGAVVARSYMNYNDQKPSVAAEYRYQTVGISWTNTYKIVTAEEARQIQDGIVIFAFPRCPYCRNLITEVTDVAVAENTTVYYCQIDRYRDRYEYNEKTGKPQMTVEAGEGYTELLSWLDEYLADYTVADEVKNKIEVGEKRIGAPTIIRIKNGEPVAKWQLDSVEGIEYPDNKYDGWDTAIKEKVEESLYAFFKEG